MKREDEDARKRVGKSGRKALEEIGQEHLNTPRWRFKRRRAEFHLVGRQSPGWDGDLLMRRLPEGDCV